MVVVKNNVIQTTEKTVSIADTIFDQENKNYIYIFILLIQTDQTKKNFMFPE